MPTKEALINSVNFKEVKSADLKFEHNGETYSIPGAIGVTIKHGVAFITCHLQDKDAYNVSGDNKVTKMRGPVSFDVWAAFNPPPQELETASRLVNKIDVPRGYEWAIVAGVPQLVRVEGKVRRSASGSKKSRSLDPNKYPVGMKVTFMEGPPGQTKPGDAGEIVGYEGNQLVIQYKKKGRVLAQPGSRHRVG